MVVQAQSKEQAVSDKCPKCGAERIINTEAPTIVNYACGAWYRADSTPGHDQPYDCLRRQLAEERAENARLREVVEAFARLHPDQHTAVVLDLAAAEVAKESTDES